MTVIAGTAGTTTTAATIVEIAGTTIPAAAPTGK